MMRISLLLLLGVYGVNSAEAGPYDFGISCASQGSWSAQALSYTNQLMNIVNNLKNDKNCSGVYQNVGPTLQAAISRLNESSASPNSGQDTMEKLPSSISALKSAWPSVKGADQSSMVQAFLGQAVNGAVTASSDANGVVAAAGALNPTAHVVSKIAERANQALAVGLDSMANIMDALPQLDQCLVGSPSLGGQYLATTIQMAATISASNPRSAEMMGPMVSRLMALMQQRRFSRVIRTLNETELWASLSCLMETTANNYCTTKEAYQTFSWELGSIKEARARATQDKNISPLEGYFLLTREAQAVTQWLAQVMMGMQPQLPTDAQFKNNTLSSMYNYQTQSNSILGAYSDKLKKMKSLTDKAQKQNTIISMLGDLVTQLTASDANSSTNFYTDTVPAIFMPFYLVGGFAQTPAAVTGAGGTNHQEWNIYMQTAGANGLMIRQFDDPDRLADTIRNNLSALISSSQNAASQYYRSRMIVDDQLLIAGAATSTRNYERVPTALKNIKSYIDRLYAKIKDQEEEGALAISAKDTSIRIDRVLQAFKKVNALNKVAYDEDKVKEAFKNVMDSLFSNFNMLLQRDGFVISRLANFVREDYRLRIQNKENMSAYQKEILLVAGKDLLERLDAMVSVNPTAQRIDFATAQSVNLGNLRAVEEMFTDNLYAILGTLQPLAAKKNPTYRELNLEQNMRKYKTMIGPGFSFLMPGIGLFDPRPGVTFLDQVKAASGFSLFQGLYDGLVHPDRFASRPSSNQKYGNDPDGTYRTIWAKYCIQTLAFEQGERFAPFCNGAILAGSKDSNDSRKLEALGLNANYNKLLMASLKKSGSNSGFENNDDRRCAFRNYWRKNQVYWMTRNLDDSE